MAGRDRLGSVAAMISCKKGAQIYSKQEEMEQGIGDGLSRRKIGIYRVLGVHEVFSTGHCTAPYHGRA